MYIWHFRSTKCMATVGSAIVCDRLRLYGNSNLCDRLPSAYPRSSSVGLTAEYPATPKHIWNLWLRGYGATKLEAKLGAR